jgi:ABC-2 type transport system ATP-binding protein
MNEIERICDEVAIIDKGKLIKQDRLDNLLSNRVSDKVLIETLYSKVTPSLGLTLLDDTMVETTQSELTTVLDILAKHEVFIKQIRYGSSNLEKYFLEVTQ